MTTVKEIIGEMVSPTPEDVAVVEKAYEFSKKAHEGQKRYSGEPYFVHPAATAKTLAEYGMDATTIAAGLLHDAVEDGRVSRADMEKEFGKELLFIVDGVTKLGTHKYRGAERHAESLRRLLVATASDIRVLIVKLADRKHNMETLEHVPSHKRLRIALETLEIYAPIANRLGMGRMKRSLEDLAFPYVDTDAASHTAEVRKLKTRETEDGLAKMKKDLQRELAKKELKNFRTDIRMKGLWSLHQKLKRKNEDINLIHDIAALRIIVPSIEDCYATLGVVHALYRPLPGEFKDYIAFPKPNGYQSLHTTVVTPDAGIVEIQIRTEEMHKRAQFGIASHMSYKQLGKNIEKMDKSVQKSRFSSLSFAWVRSLIPSLMRFSKKDDRGKKSETIKVPPWLAELADAHTAITGSADFVEGLKEDFFSHRVFVFTPKGDVIDLPVESTPIDFAYAIHSDLGDHLQGAKVNGKLVSFDTKLGNGEVVEIIRRDSAHPSPKWLDIVRTSLARRHIRAALGMTEQAGMSRRRRRRAKQ
ncbi:MAG: bifunctional (p)ppGpp synthetase/guanosine-3',5'-bis(diphosphate) 3'-pyrophosphohydrolase [Candidatus Sungbacteria bacterium]|uniref:Bifunctional (P)ppGpp synthetase/guanosine-3',5'-bis(Diphosphate) 3'-pyrophosphohydrolase n=1 Tax=Candidatus Sungiibacteriota bacterium TaxID=2750080 RepID=A0A932YWE8_9BACT|nr:bifunctional (p)ppGpp synthetase/guanosine-3',5'-bis(diphosphate) 3'-pyrophosphohydrolase [Candidatus Sungbacteria bacterium]